MPFPSSTGLRPKRICRNGAKGRRGGQVRRGRRSCATRTGRCGDGALVVYADAQERKVSQLQAALDTRVVIEQAIGILAERFVLSLTDAFEVIRAAARNSRREVRAVAEELRASRETPLAITEVLPPGADRS